MVIAQLLKKEFSARQARNKRYSIRSFAQRLDMDATALLRLMKGERIPTQKTVKKILHRLGYSAEEEKRLLAKTQNTPAIRIRPLDDAFDLRSFEKIMSTEHVLVLSSLRLTRYSVPQLKDKICNFLDLNAKELEKILMDLQHLGAIQIKNSQIKVIYKNKSTVPLPLTTEKLREIQKNFLAMAATCIDHIPIDERDNATLTVAVHTENLPEIKKILRNTRAKINTLAEKNKNPNAVYNVSTALYPVIS